MKYLKLFEQFINEMEIGKDLFTKSPVGMGGNFVKDIYDLKQWDWEHSRYHYKKDNREFTKKLKDSFKNIEELNTPEEHRLLDFLSSFVETGYGSSAQRRLPDSIYNDLKYLLKVKKKFPLILDPQMGSNNLGKVWRGAAIPLSQAKEVLEKGKKTTNKINDWASSSIELTDRYEIKMDVRSRALIEKKAASFTTDWTTANVFYNTRIQNIAEDDDVPVILEVDVKSPNLLFNPNFLNLFSDYEENETWYVSDKGITVSAIHLNPRAVHRAKNK